MSPPLTLWDECCPALLVQLVCMTTIVKAFQQEPCRTSQTVNGIAAEVSRKVVPPYNC
jgi:hypothetical protein